MSRKRARRRFVRPVLGEAGAERSEAEASPDGRRGRPGRRSVDERTQAVLDLFAGKATVDQLVQRFGVQASTVERWREQALGGVEQALRQGSGKSPRELELERERDSLEKAFTHLAIKHELVERALRERPSKPERWSR